MQSDQLTSRMPFIEKTFNVHEFTRWMLRPSLNDLRTAIRDCKGVSMRFSVWRLLTSVLDINASTEQKLAALECQRSEYQALIARYVKNEDIVTKAPLKKDPLSRDTGQGVSTNYYENHELRNTIKMDVTRTYQEIRFFEHAKIKNLLVNVLFIWSKKNSTISYIQGMNEVAASLVYVYFQECLDAESNDLFANSEHAATMFKFNDLAHAEADIYTLFQQVMNNAQHMEMFRPNYTDKQKQQLGSKKPSPILNRIAKLQDVSLKIVDIELFRHVKLLDVELRVFLLRWLRCIFTREFTLAESFIVWDAIFLEYCENPENNQLNLIDCIALSMMSFVRQQVLDQEETSQCYQKFLKYPQIANLKTLMDTAFIYKDMLKDPERIAQLNEQTLPILFGKQPLTIEREEPKKVAPQVVTTQKQQQTAPKAFMPMKSDAPKKLEFPNQKEEPKPVVKKEEPRRAEPRNQPVPVPVVPYKPEPQQQPQLQPKPEETKFIQLAIDDVQIIIKALSDGIAKLSSEKIDRLTETQADMEEIKLMLEREIQTSVNGRPK